MLLENLNRFLPILKTWKKILFIISAPVLLLPLPLSYGGTEASKCAFLVLLMAFYWMTEVIPLPITGLLPIIFLPLFGILDTTAACTAYMNEAIMIGIGSILVAIAVERCNLHQRIALWVLTRLGTTPKRLLAGFMMTSMFLSMWIGPTPVVAMMVPIVQSVLNQLKMSSPNLKEMEDPLETISETVPDSAGDTQVIIGTDNSKDMMEGVLLKRVLLLGICFSANVGGCGTIPATAPNLVFKTVIEKLYPKYSGMAFTSWMLFNLPGMIMNGLLLWTLLVLMYIRKITDGLTDGRITGITFLFFCLIHLSSYMDNVILTNTTVIFRCQNLKKSQTDRKQVKIFLLREYSKLGKLTFHEGAVFVLFLILAVLWLFRKPEFMDGWGELMPISAKVTDATSTLAVASLLFVIPSAPSLRTKCPSLLEWSVAQEKLPWGVFILLGGGFSLAEGAQKSGFSKWLGQSLTKLNVSTPLVFCLILCLIVLCLVEISGNTATATVVFPVIGSVADLTQINPLYLLLSAAVCSSYAFMFPVSSAPNALIYETFKIKIKDVAVPGLIAKFICLSVTFLMINTLGNKMFQLDTFPSWATPDDTSSGTTEFLFTTEIPS